jgi:hypothetical protein
MDPILKLDQLLHKSFPEQVWAVDGLVPAAAFTILAGPPASYKTAVLLHTALSVAKGEPLFGQFATRQSGVLIIDEENGERLLHQRLKQLGAMANLPIWFTPRKGFIVNKENVDNVLLSCQTYGIKLLIIDSLIRIHGSDENSAGEMAEVFKKLRCFTDNGITILMTHHNRKPGIAFNGASEMRGSSEILAAVDSHIGLSRKRSKLTFTQTKQRYAKELEPFAVQVVEDDDNFSFAYAGAAKENNSKLITDAVMKLLGEHERLFQKELLKRLEEQSVKTNEHKLRELMKDLVEDGAVLETAGSGKTKYYSLNSVVSDD